MQSRSYLAYMRHTAQRPWLSCSAAAMALLVVGTGLLDRLHATHKIALPIIGLLLAWLAWEMYRGISQFWAASRGGFDRSYASYLGLGFALLGCCALLLRLTGELYSPFYPLMYLTLAFLASIGTSQQGALWFGYAFLLEVAALIASGLFAPGVVGLGALHLLFFAIFAGSHHLFLHGMLRELSEARNRKRTAELHKSLAPEAPAYTGPDMTGLSLASIDQDRQILLSRLKEGLDAHGCALLWLDQEGEYFEVMGIETDAAQFDVGPFSAQTGVPASLFKGESTLRLSRTSDHPLHLPYYGNDVLARSWLAVPIRQGQIIRGALCVDRIHPVPFSGREELVLEATATILARAIENERTLQRGAQHLEQLSQLSDIAQHLADAPSPAALAEIALELAATIVPFEWGLFTVVHPEDTIHTVLSTTPEVAYLYQQSFDFSGSLLSLTSKHGCILPERGMLRTKGPLIAADDPPLPEFASISIIPLQQRKEAIGYIILGSQDPQLFAPREVEKKLTVFAQQVASSFASIQSQQQVERLSHNDSLTGLANHSSFMEGLNRSFVASKRNTAAHQMPPQQALIMFNIDNFRYINERYGHVTGDQVLRRISKLLHDLAESGDLVARYSGEEIAFLCKGLTISEALKYADHICQQLSLLEICSSDIDPEVFTLTISAGVACSPEHAGNADTLLRHATEALLQAKQRGGNQAVLYANSADGVALATPNPDARPSITPPPGWGWGSLPPLNDPQEFRDPERWSLASFSGDQSASFNADSPSGSPLPKILQQAQRPQPVPPALPQARPLPVPATPDLPPPPTPLVEDTHHSTPVIEELLSLSPDEMASIEDDVMPLESAPPAQEPQEALGPSGPRLLHKLPSFPPQEDDEEATPHPHNIPIPQPHTNK